MVVQHSSAGYSWKREQILNKAKAFLTEGGKLIVDIRDPSGAAGEVVVE